jgi:DNA-directed RNA polymerase subunit RPC12/RpoP
LFGDNLHAGPSISHLSGSLLADVYAGDNSAVGLAGQVMTFRTGTAEQKARLLKEVGEAFYGWKPQGDESLLQPLIDWVHAELDAVQLGNRIMVVQVGDRYDMQRHNAKQAGVEVAEVYGWIVLRDNGKVFSKANVPSSDSKTAGKGNCRVIVLCRGTSKGKTNSTMKTYVCANCGAEVRRPAPPLSCQSCGQQRIGLFKVKPADAPAAPAPVAPSPIQPPGPVMRRSARPLRQRRRSSLPRRPPRLRCPSPQRP